MRRREMGLGFCAGLVAGLVVAIVLLSGRATPRVAAQAVGAEIPRFELKVWAYPAAVAQGSSYPGSHGAYVLSTSTGKLWETVNGSDMKPLKIVGQAN